MPADGEDDEEDAGAGTPGGLTAQALWDSRAVTWAAATQVHERSKRQKLVTKKWPLPLHKLPGTGAQGEVRLRCESHSHCRQKYSFDTVVKRRVPSTSLPLAAESARGRR